MDRELESIGGRYKQYSSWRLRRWQAGLRDRLAQAVATACRISWVLLPIARAAGLLALAEAQSRGQGVYRRRGSKDTTSKERDGQGQGQGPERGVAGQASQGGPLDVSPASVTARSINQWGAASSVHNGGDAGAAAHENSGSWSPRSRQGGSREHT